MYGLLKEMSSIFYRSNKFSEFQTIFNYFCTCTDWHEFNFQSHRIQQLENAALAANDNAAMRLDTPTFLVRRYEVSIIPSVGLKPKKLREVKSNGILVLPFYVFNSSII